MFSGSKEYQKGQIFDDVVKTVLHVPLDRETTTARTKRQRYLSEAKAERLLAATPTALRFAVAAGLFGGFRAMAAVSVLLTHVAFDTGFDVRSSWGRYFARADVGVAVFFLISGFLLYRPFVASHLHGNAPTVGNPRGRGRVSGAAWHGVKILGTTGDHRSR